MFHVLLISVVIVVIIYLIIRRLQERDNEDFEKRDN